MTYAGVGGVTGLDVLNVLANNPQQIPILFTDTGLLLQENPPGSGTLVPVNPPLVLPSLSYMQDALAFNRMYMAIGDGQVGTTPPIVLDGPSGVTSIVGQNPIGALWAENTLYQVADLVRSSDGRWWRCFVAASTVSSVVPPQWPAFDGYWAVEGVTTWVPATVTDPVSGSHWEEWTPNAVQYLPPPDMTSVAVTHVPGGGTISSGKDVYVKLTYLIPQSGEGPRSTSVVFSNTSANDEIVLTFTKPSPAGSDQGPYMPRWLAEINLQPGSFYPFSINVWIAIVSHGASAPADSAYGLSHAAQSLSRHIAITSATTIAPTGQSVVSVTITAPGLYTARPTVSFTGGAGSGATGIVIAKVVFLGSVYYEVIGVSMISGGSGYTSQPAVVFSTSSEVAPAAGTSTLGGGGGGGTTNFPQGAAITPTSITAPPVFIGEGGTRYMIVLRENLNGSLSPVDPGSPIAVNFLGELNVQIVAIVRDSSGNVTITVGDITGFVAGQQIEVQGCTNDTSFNGSFALANVQSTLSPEGILQFNDPNNLSAASNDNTGSVQLPAGPAPIAFLPQGGTTSQQNIAAFTTIAPQDGQPVQLQAGPFNYIPQSDPTQNFQSPIVSMQGPLTLVFAGVTLTRAAGGEVSAAVADISGIIAGAFVTVAGATDSSFDGQYLIAGVSAGTGTAGVVTWIQSDTGATSTTGNLTIQQLSGQVQAVLVDASGLAAGDVVNVTGASPSSFDGPATLASVMGNVVTFPSFATGTATVVGAVMQLLQDLPTTSSVQTATITSIIRDFAGNVTAQVPYLAGWAAGQSVTIAAVADSSFNGQFELTSAALNDDGITASLSWVQTSSVQSTSSGGTVSSISDLILNFDDNFLSNGQDVTSQLTALAPPNSSDVYFSENLNRIIYTKGNDTQHYFSNINDAENINQSGGILSVAASNGSPTVCIREMENGEILSLKGNAGYAIIQNNLTPDQWGVERRWKSRGPVNARAVDVGPDFLILFTEYTGPYKYQEGKLVWIGQELQGTWDRVNWAAKNTICVAVDDDNKTVHFSLPLDGSSVPNKDVTVNYFNGWQDPLILNMMGQVIPNRYGRRWSEDDLQALSMKAVKRTLNPVVNSKINDKQLLFGIAQTGADNVFVDMPLPDSYSDDGTVFANGEWGQLGIDWQYQPAYDQSPTCDVLRVAKAKGQLLGSGPINFQVISNDPSVQVDPVQVIPDKPTVAKSFSIGLRLGQDSSNIGININNGAVPGVWAQLHKLILGGNEEYPSEKTT